MSSNLKKYKIAVLISGSGTNLQALLDAQTQKYFESEILLVASNINALGLQRAAEQNIQTLIFDNEQQLKSKLVEKDIDLLVLAGFLKIISSEFIKEFKGKIINIHPSLLPKYGGKGMYGINVHQKVFENKDSFSGATVHLVDGGIDTGKIINQQKVGITNCKSPQEIAKSVLEVEHKILKETIKQLENIE